MLVEASGESGAEDRPRHGGGRADREQGPVDAAGEVAEHSRDPEAEADRHIRPDGTERICADEAEQRADPQ